MYVMFADGSGSGKAAAPSRDPGFYVLSGVVVHESHLQRLQDDIADLKQSLFPGVKPHMLELHAHEIWHNRGLFSPGNLGPKLDDKRQIFDRVVDLACSPTVALISVTIDKSLDIGMKGRHWPLERSWIDMVKVFRQYLSPKRGAEYGLIVADASERMSEQLIAKTTYRTARRYGTGQRRSPVLDGMFFRDSRLESVIQLADMVGYVIHKHMKGDPAFFGWHERLGGNIYGHAAEY